MLVTALKDQYHVIGLTRQAAANRNELKVDIARKEQTMEPILKVAPVVVVHAAAETSVDRCETQRGLAEEVNVTGTANVAESCAKIGAKLIFISTDYVFDGVKGNYVETDQPNPVNFYGLTKLRAEHVVATTLSNSLIVRTSVLYGWHPTKLNFATWILKELREQQPVKLAIDHVNSPTFADNLAGAVRMAIERDSGGILHIAGTERISRFDFAVRIAKTFRLEQSRLVPVKMQDLDWIARRPRDSSLSVEKAERELGIELYGVHRGLEEMLKSRPAAVPPT